MKARIIGLGTYLPERILSNEDLEKMVDTSDEWIVSRTGMKERRLASKDEFPSTMGAAAAMRALEAAGVEASHIDTIITATMTPDYISPSTSCLIQSMIGATHAAAFDIQAACTGYIYALSIAKGMVESGQAKHVLVIAAEKMSAFVDYSDRTTCVLFGDGASAACVAAKGEGLRIDAVSLGADGHLSDLIKIPAGGSRQPASMEEGAHFFRMAGNEVFKHAVRRMSASARESLGKLGLNEMDVEWLVPHQANKRIIDAIAKQFDLPEKKVYQNIHKYGNTSASSIGIALAELLDEETLAEGAHLLLTAFGAGLTFGSAVLTKVMH